MSLSFTRKTDYALVALSELAREHHQEQSPLSARRLADEFKLPLPLLMNALKELHRAGILSSRRGAGGGYSLAKPPEALSLLEIIECLEGTINISLCSDGGAHAEEEECGGCSIVHTCPISMPIQRLNTLLQNFLAGISLADLTTNTSIIPLTGLGVRV
ncbi:RrF2 family transcriptional regulator [Acanthopleuribacter pedis]|uniref:Rrf2 family transcriptional regulator n=1 Tax=Acanthopleuribacter pedis TaxID=442870 RepID=A0A8J7QLE3_9BACT|nr:Rrf2 family transcriptional regulator [Acanthopleuribacter pedis]MBO1320125.1 Rrf2 family transcriptional regulator [Acanthopleuribacter pedis]